VGTSRRDHKSGDIILIQRRQRVKENAPILFHDTSHTNVDMFGLTVFILFIILENAIFDTSIIVSASLFQSLIDLIVEGFLVRNVNKVFFLSQKQKVS